MSQERKNGVVVTSQSIEAVVLSDFNKLYDRLVKHSDRRKLKKPKKGDLMTSVIKAGLSLVTVENYYTD